MQPGTQLGHYEILSAIGKGGMGEVWRAKDTKLGRDVAIKTLPPEFAQDSDRLTRFEREAKLLASLNHPNIAAIHGLEQSDDTRFLVLELVEGDTLADRLKRGAIPVEESLKLALQIAEALEAAHEKGVIHRDLKPANIKVTPEGKVKVLDFGLAKAFIGDDEADVNLSNSPTLSIAATKQGMILGTAAYMSPEQARGRRVNKSTDIWAFGCVLFEMLTGRVAFPGADVTDIMAAVIRAEPEWNGLPPNLHPRLRETIGRCLEKDTKARYHDIADVRVDIEKVLAQPSGVLLHTPAVRSQRSQLPWLAAVVAAALASLAVWAVMWEAAAPPDTPRLTIVTPVDQSLVSTAEAPHLAISPDGSRVVYAGVTPGGGTQLYQRRLDQLEITPLDGTEGGAHPFFSPDGEWVGFVRGGTSLMKVSIFGGAPEQLSTLPTAFRGAAWGIDDQIIVGTTSSTSGLVFVPAAGGEFERVPMPGPSPGATSYRWPSIIPNSNVVLFVITTGAAIGTGEIAALDRESGEVMPLGLMGTSPHPAGTEHVSYVGTNGALFAAPFDVNRLEVVGRPQPVLDSVRVGNLGGGADVSLSDTGRLVYVGAGDGDLQSTMGWVDRDGQMTTRLIESDTINWPRLSPQGDRVAVVMRGLNVWIRDIARESDSLLTEVGANVFPIWKSDGAVTFGSNRSGPYNVYSRPADLSSPAQRVVDVPENAFPGSWSSDGETLLFHKVGLSTTQRDLWVLPAEGDAEPVLVTGFNELSPRLSPDGQWVAYISDQSGDSRIYVQRFPEGGEVFTISTGRGTEPVWSRDGSELFYRDGRRMMAVEVELSPEFSPGNPRLLFEHPYELDAASGGVPNYDVSLDGQQFLMVARADVTNETSRAPQINVILNWFEELKERVPVP